MDHLTYDHLLATLDKVGAVLIDQGFPKGSFQIGFNPASMDEKLTSLKAAAHSAAHGAPIVTPQFACHFGGCGVICCEWSF
ncbi:hypothetical protein LGM57_34040 [Burkholderia cepacia]|uniref:hypothetical protein n=1 Tax=Burkholderia cepacia TaxID=292 RepID=UPI001CF3F58C|nr:hypothetical protein [Burkholderia cepacia]MCA7981358.1 hypothetical protein [Burkholderia cepacia]HDR9497164.1 hypothetical protein [Burkholderia cepacia]